MTTPGEPGRAEPVSPADVMALGAAVALTTGLLESAVVFTRRHAGHTLAFTGADAYWLAPLSYLALFAPLILVLAVAVRWLPRPAAFRAVLGVLSWVAVGSLLFLAFHRRIALVAQLALAAGIATALVRSAAARQAAWCLGARRASFALAGCVALLAGTPLARSIRERWTLAHLPAAREGAPNILLIILDTVRAASLGLYGGSPTSAGIERWAARGVVFDHAYATAPWTLPSHASIFTGRYPRTLGADWLRSLDGRQPTLAETFQSAGYRTAGFTANLYYTSVESGLARGFQRYREYRLTWRQAVLTSALGQLLEETRLHAAPARRINDRKRAVLVSTEARQWLPAGRRPWFVFLNYFDAHLPYHPPPVWRGRLPSANERLEAYEESIAGLDAHIDSLLAELDRSGLLRNTIVVLTSDHGESVGEHGLTEHGFGLYVQDLHVPLVMLGPGVPTGLRVPATVSLIDIGATLADLAGLPATFAGHSLAPLWRAPRDSVAVSPALAQLEPLRNARPAWPIARGPMQSLVSGRLHLIQRGDGARELFDLANDAAEEHDLAADPRYAGRLQGLREALARAEGH